MKTVIVGGVAGGASTAARLRRLDENMEIVMLERGGEISYANCGLPYYIGGIIEDEDELLLQTAESMHRRFRIDVRLFSEATKIDRAEKCVEIYDSKNDRTYRESYDKLVLAPGAEPIRPRIPGVDLACVYTLRTVPDTLAIRKLIDDRAVQFAVIVGGGFIGVEMAENLRAQNVEVTLVEAAPQILTQFDPEMAAILQKSLEAYGIKVLTAAAMTEIREKDNGAEVVLADGQTLGCDIVMLAVGVRPESSLAAAAGLTLNARGGIITDDKQLTNDPDIYAVGDAIELFHRVLEQKAMIPLAGPANKQARVVAGDIVGREEHYAGAIGSSVLKVVNLTGACSGASERALKQAGISYRKVYLEPASHAGYYPGGSQLTVKLLYADDGRVLGVQCVGEEGVDKRVDVIAAVISMQGTVYDLTKIDLCYAPPYSSAKDPVNFAGYIAVNELEGLAPMWHWEELQKPLPENVVLVDARTRGEYKRGHLRGSIHVPVDSMREQLDRIPKDKEVWVYCQVGLRGYIAQRILMQSGFEKVRNLSGGYRLLTVAGLLNDRINEIGE